MYKFLNGSDIVTMINTIGAKEYLGDRSSLLSLESATYLLFSEKIEIQRLWGKWESFIFYLSDAGYSGRFLYVKYRKRGVNEFKILNEDGSLVMVLPLEPVERCAENTKRGISSSFCEVLNCFCLRMPICKSYTYFSRYITKMNIRYANKVEVKCHYNSLLPIYDELYSHLVQDCSDTIHSILIEDIDVDRVLFELNNFKCIVNLNDNSVSHSNNYPYSSKEYTIPKRIRDSLVCIQKLSDKPIHKILFIKPNCIESIVPYWYEVISPRCPSEIDTYFYFVQFRSV